MQTTNRHILHALGVSRTVFKRWMRRAFFIIGGLTVGAAAVLMALLADKAQFAFNAVTDHWPYAAFVLSPLGFALAALLARTIFPNSQGSGIPQVIAARALEEPAARLGLVSLRVGFGKIVTMLLGLLCGASIGREGPTAQVGAAIMYAFGRRAPRGTQNGLLIAGASAGIAAAFNTPLAGIVFGIEELSRSFEVRTSGLVIGCVIAAGITSLALLGDYSYFGSTAAVLPLGPSWVIVPLCGVVGGLMGGLFSRLLVLFAGGLPGPAGAWIKAHPILFAALCGLTVAACGAISGGSIYGTGYEQARSVVHEAPTVGPYFAPLKFVATVVSSISGIPGGIFAPSLAVGAGLGNTLHEIFTTVPIGALALLGMVAYLAGVVQTPITSFVIVSEMTADHGMIIPLMVAALIATFVSKVICPEGLYHSLAENFIPAGAAVEPPARDEDALDVT